MNKANKIIFGCLGTLIITIIIGWFALNWLKSKTIKFIAETSHEVLNDSLKQSKLPKDQKKAILTVSQRLLDAVSSGEIDFNFDGSFKDPEAATEAIAVAGKEAFASIEHNKSEQIIFDQQIDRLRQNFLADNITPDETTQMAEQLAKGPFGLSFTAWAIHSHYVTPSTLSDNEKVNAKVTVNTLINGINNKLINIKDIETILEPYQEKNADGQKSLKSQLSDDEIKNIFSEFNKLITDNKVTPPETSLSIANELKKAFNDAGMDKLK